ncbi:hypothetical protein B0T21DRAFT_130775 [Apiosordaria backusii]|uniref:Uncharacterized protein n=1 Tax=Apiosordaria backusii TaxID=314023 RepID=A0AA40EN93_9PEZI|nr:hypothetical protein B0T21DRAFT_130775 [Apiosordaria backusii]
MCGTMHLCGLQHHALPDSAQARHPGEECAAPSRMTVAVLLSTFPSLGSKAPNWITLLVALLVTYIWLKPPLIMPRSSSGSSSGSNSSSGSSSGSRRMKQRMLPKTPAVNTLIWFTGRDPRKVKGVRAYYYDDDFETGSNVESKGVYWAEYPDQSTKTKSRPSGRASHPNATAAWARNASVRDANDDDDSESDDGSSSDGSESEYGHQQPGPFAQPPGPMRMGMPNGGPPPMGRPPMMGGPPAFILLETEGWARVSL